MNILKIIGAGMKGISHLTQESIAELKTANKIVWLGTMEGAAAFFADYASHSEDISYCYQNGALDSDNYRAIKNKVFEDLNRHHEVALVLLGHPRLGVTIVQEFQQETLQQGFALQVLPGISSFDTMINDLEIDPIEEGSCLVDANRLILYDYQMDPCLNYFVYHVCSIGNSHTDYETPDANNAVYFLQEKLLKHFPAQHEIFLIQSSSAKDSQSNARKGTIADLKILLQHVTFDSSLFIPATLPLAKNVNMKFYKYLGL